MFVISEFQGNIIALPTVIYIITEAASVRPSVCVLQNSVMQGSTIKILGETKKS